MLLSRGRGLGQRDVGRELRALMAQPCGHCGDRSFAEVRERECLSALILPRVQGEDPAFGVKSTLIPR